MQTFFWLDEDNHNTFHLFQLVRNPGKYNSDDNSVRYNDSNDWPATRSCVNEKGHDEKLTAINGNLIPETIYIRFKHPAINDRLAKFAKTKKWQKNLFASKDTFPSEEAFQQEMAQMNEACEQITQHLVDTNIVVKKEVSRIAIKVYLEN